MTTVEVSLEDVTVCAPCDQGAAHPESHAPETRGLLLADRVPVDVPEDRAVAALVHGVRSNMKVSGPITVHQSPVDDINLATGQRVREWVATQP